MCLKKDESIKVNVQVINKLLHNKRKYYMTYQYWKKINYKHAKNLKNTKSYVKHHVIFNFLTKCTTKDNTLPAIPMY